VTPGDSALADALAALPPAGTYRLYKDSRGSSAGAGRRDRDGFYSHLNEAANPMLNLRNHENPLTGAGITRARLPVMRNLSDMRDTRWPNTERRFLAF
jgi:hypothetical protein